MAMAPRAELYLQLVCEEVIPRESMDVGDVFPFTLGSHSSESLVTSPRFTLQQHITLDSAVSADYSQKTLTVTRRRESNGERAPKDFGLVFNAMISPATISSDLKISTLVDVDASDLSNSTTPGVPGETPPSRAERCRKSSLVVSLSTALQLKMTLAMGLLSVATTGFWTALSDRRGRTLVLSEF